MSRRFLVRTNVSLAVLHNNYVVTQNLPCDEKAELSEGLGPPLATPLIITE